MIICFYFFFLFGVKFYLAYGLRQVFVENRSIAIGYFILSSLCTLLGIFTFYTAFRNNPSIVTMGANFSIALMISVLICEFILAAFFLIDDFVRIGQWTINKVASAGNVFESENRRRLIKAIGVGITTIPFASFIYGITKGKYAYKVYRETLTFKDLPKAFDGFKIVQFSDVHSGSFDDKAAVLRGIETMQNLKPDLILFTGDIVNDYESEIIPFKDMFSQLNAPYGKHAILGNHDYPFHGRMFEDKAHGQRNLEALKKHIIDMGFNLMLNENQKLEKDDEYIRLVGVENWSKSRYFGKLGDLNKATADCDENEFTVLMTHDPTHWDEQVIDHDRKFHLTLAGHTHGFQMGIELPFLKWSPAKYMYKQWAGLYKEKEQYLYVNRGFGFLGFAGRVGIPPEITEITLRRA